ncbi:uncharacterized protein [Dysidea avara]|uniref:uncharacterized protein n=1 Tax=Dysidea avara TaxID=196820 RepID=UPI00331FA8FC
MSQAVTLELHRNALSNITKRSIATTTPAKQCTSDNEGENVYNPANPLVIWICKSTTWTPFELSPSTGKTKELSATNCKQIKEALSTDCTRSLESGVYWAQDMQVCMHFVVTAFSQSLPESDCNMILVNTQMVVSTLCLLHVSVQHVTLS